MGRFSMPNGLHVSVSQVKCFLRCPRQFELKYVRAETPAFIPVALAFGSAFHEALAAYYGKLKHSGEVLRRDLLLDTFRTSWKEQCSGEIPIQPDAEDEGNLDQLTDKGISMLHAFCEHSDEERAPIVESIEQGFSVPIFNPDTGEEFEEKLVGFMDLMVIEDGHRIVVEHKTAARKYGLDQIRFDIQPTAYKIAAREMGLGEEVGLRYQVITKTKVPVVQVEDLIRDDQDEYDFLMTVSGVLKAIDAGVNYPLRGWGCKTCPYSHACTNTGGVHA